MTVYFTYDDEKYFIGTVSADAMPENATTFAPENKAGYWYKFDGEVWNAQKIPENVADIIGLSVPALPTDTTTKDTATKHESVLRSIIMRILSATEDATAVVADGVMTVKEVTAADKLAIAKENKLAELNEVAHKFDNGLVCDDMIIKSSLGFNANADLRSQNNIDSLITANTEPVQYCDADNIFHSLTLDNLKTLKSECIQNGLSLYQQKWQYRSAISSATTINEVNAIKFNFTMLDFGETN